jgi:hypothetical protein
VSKAKKAARASKKAKALACQCKMISYDGTADDEGVIRIVPLLDDGTRSRLEYVAWIPKKKAVVGKWLRIDKMRGNWQVEEVWATKDAAEVNVRSRDHLHTREASDV